MSDNNSFQESINTLSKSPNHKILSRVPENITQKSPTGKIFKLAIIDLETTGLNPKLDEVIEIGILITSFTNEDGLIKINDKINYLNEPKNPISDEITKITGITNEDVKGQKIDWNLLKDKLTEIDLIICHNAYFDRNFMELQTNDNFKSLISSKSFACSSHGVNWRLLGYESSKLEYLNFKMGYFYDGHRAINDCYATLNLFTSNNKAFEELKENARKKEYLICAIDSGYDKKDILKERGYKWSNGDGNLPKTWWIKIPETEYEAEMSFLRREIYYRHNIDLPTKMITAKERYSYRGENI